MPSRSVPSSNAHPTPSDRLEVAKTFKLFVGGAFPRSESGRSLIVHDHAGSVLAHVAHASRKDLRDAVEAAAKAQPAWASATAYNRGQVLYRMAEMLEGRKAELADALTTVQPAGARSSSKQSPAARRSLAQREVATAIDRVVHFAGWCDKHAQVLGVNNPVSGPFYNFTIPEATGVVAVVCPDEHPLLAMVSLLAPVLVPGNAALVLASDANPLPAVLLGEVCATSDVPAGVVNILTGQRSELLPFVSQHRAIDAIHAAGLPEAQATLLREGRAENLKRVTVHDRTPDWFDARACQGPWWIEPFVEFKTMWHPAQG